MAIWNFITRFEDRLAAVGAGTALMAMMLMSVIGVLGRYVFQADLIPGAYNMIERVIFPLMVFWALPAAHREMLFPRLEMLAEALHPRWRPAVSALALLVELAIYLVVLWFVTTFVIQTIKTGRTMQVGTDFWPLWPVVVMIPISFALMVAEMLRLLWVDARRLLTGQDNG
ncbi:TRAP transporter small permease [Seohaeicola nanhaiensis]|uniref:TRAP transporter small permease protein n=1 Tax=Seohaeicola nanhaiensis TaxID=1387282 RepID=A0ABV9KNB0_9RHOB